ncbi:hypothetical protein C8J27_1141 [Rhodobacter aestuarii]|uniref:Uncharacterized protein n=1 Tax=Rhodobacter aestuarii TaxID=453582 RepID=A0A1N7QDH0_9RHOB|nr:hypothetical protein [Rhodobacter aestuarii]PTV93555.1 hypothetical protein C8J27_1141 [Rhodobacter aestuarii]SIT20617.1 hypothetical protein SAMN05421580_1161 [Rhodobacter aestuarii]
MAFRCGQLLRISAGNHLLSWRTLARQGKLLVAEGAVVESLWSGPITAAALGPETCAEIGRACPELPLALHGRVSVEAVFGLTRRELRALTCGLARPRERLGRIP